MKAKTLLNYYLDDDGRAIVAIVVLPQKKGVRIYVAWEWEKQVKQGIVGFFQLDANEVTPATIKEACEYGQRISDEKNIKKIFSLQTLNN